MDADALLARLHETHRARLERIVDRRLRDPELAADLVSEAFLRLHKQLATGQTPEDPAAWLTRVAVNLALSEGRHRQVVRRTADRLPRPGWARAAEDEVVARDAVARLSAALAELSSGDRLLVVAAAGGASGAQLAAATGRTEGGVRTRLFRARQRLRLDLAEPA
jgi:RNA polymerase sigma factor (sigma-70 family)